MNGLTEEVFVGGHGLLCERVFVVAELMEVEALGIRAVESAQEVRAVLGRPVGRSQQFPAEPRTVDGCDARCGVVVAPVCDVAADGWSVRGVCVVYGVKVDYEFEDLAVLSKVLLT